MRLLAALLCLLAPPMQAATLSPGGDETMGCTVTLSGQIDRGDSDRLYDYLTDNGLGQGETQARLCLDSPGGSYIDGVRMGSLLTQYGIGTAIPAGARCESACAIAFMGGAWTGEEGAFVPDRTMHPRARLGFHAPSLTVADRSYTKAEIDTAYGIALIAVSELMQLRIDTQFDFPDALMLEMLATPPQSLRHIETAVDAAQWNIAVWPLALPDASAKTLTEIACHNGAAQIWDNGQGALQTLPQDFVNEMRSEYGTLSLTTVYAYADNAARCRVRLSPGWAGLHRIGDVSFPDFEDGRRADLHTIMLYPPDTLIADLAPAEVPFEAIPALFTTEVTSALSCTFPDDRAFIGNVNEFVNMRAAPSFGAEVIREVGKGEVVDILAPSTPRVAPPDASARARCEQACADPTSPDAQLVLQQCIDDNALWHEVRTTGGTGWISRRFLTRP